MRHLALALIMLLYAAVPAHAQVSVGVGIRTHGVSIGFNMSSYPRMVAIPGYPVYYDPRANSNYFFYDGLYWVYQNDNWYSSAWYNGPWDLIGPEDVPLFVLRIPVRYYCHRPAYFSGWSLNLAPRWGEHWGHDWEQRRSGWDKWDRRSVPSAAPLPSYQSRYSGSRYPRATDQQYSIESRNYRYQPREAISQQYFQERAVQSGARPMKPTPVQTQRPISTQNRTQTQIQAQQRQKQTQDKAQVLQQKRAQGTQAQQKQRADVQRQTQQKQKQAQDEKQIQQQKRMQDAQAKQQRVNVQRQTQLQQKRVEGQAQQQQRATPVQKSKAAERKAGQQNEVKDDKTGGGPGNSK